MSIFCSRGTPPRKENPFSQPTLSLSLERGGIAQGDLAWHSMQVYAENHISPSTLVYEENHISPSTLVYEENHISPSIPVYVENHISPSILVYEETWDGVAGLGGLRELAVRHSLLQCLHRGGGVSYERGIPVAVSGSVTAFFSACQPPWSQPRGNSMVS